MNSYEAIFVRKTVHNFVNDPISEQALDALRARFHELPSLFGITETDISILDNRTGRYKRRSLVGNRAPYYMVFYSQDAPRSQMNAGYMVQQMALYLCTLGFGSSLVTDPHFLRHDLRRKGNLQAIAVLAFGRGKGSYLHKKGDFKRLSLDELCTFKETPHDWMKKLLEAARLAPSVLNAQPWRFVVYDTRIHIFSKKHQADSLQKYRWEEVNFGIMFANLLTAAEELWLDVDLIRLENISQKNFPNSQYILSAVFRS